MDQFVKMSPFHLPFHLGAEGIINGARPIQKIRWSPGHCTGPVPVLIQRAGPPVNRPSLFLSIHMHYCTIIHTRALCTHQTLSTVFSLLKFGQYLWWRWRHAQSCTTLSRAWHVTLSGLWSLNIYLEIWFWWDLADVKQELIWPLH